MTARLTLTDAGAGAIADGANVGLAAVTFTRLALGSGTGAGDQSARTALAAQHDIVAVTGAAPTPDRIALRGDYMPSQAYAVTEVGLFARVGAGGAEFLLAYWIAESATDAVAAAALNTVLIIAGVVEVVGAEADITVTPAVNIAVGVPANVVYQSQHATEDRRGILEISTRPETSAGTDDASAVTPLKLAQRLAAYATRTWVTTAINALGIAAYATRAWVLQQLATLPAAASVPTGVCLDYAGAAAPAGYLLCDGVSVSRTTFAALFAAIGTTYGAGDGGTTFGLPDFRRRVAVGAGGSASTELGATRGSSGGAEAERLTEQQTPAHEHDGATLVNADAPGHSHGSGSYAAALAGSHSHGSGSYAAALAGSHSHTARFSEHQLRTWKKGEGADVTYGVHDQNSNPATSITGSHTHDVAGASGASGSHTHDVAGASSTVGPHTHSISGATRATGGGEAHNNIQPSLVVTKIIKT